jgi:hypothetical protein
MGGASGIKPNMQTNGQPHVGATAKSVAEHASTLTRLEIELALLEVKKKVAALGIGVGMAVGAGLFAVFALGFAFATAGLALSLVVSTWLAFLIVTGALFLGAGMLGMLALGAFKKGTPPVPEKAIHEAKLTTTAIKS